MSCQERSGFLFAHGCDRVAGAKCSKCQKDVCSLHIGKGLCTTCQRQAAGRTRGRPAGENDDPYFYADTYYHDYHYYDGKDQAVFDASAVEAGAADFEGDFEGS